MPAEPPPTLFDQRQPELDPAAPEGPTLRQRFDAFHQANPWVLVELERMTQELLDAGRTRAGIAMLFEVLRWQRARTRTAESFKLNNDFKALYVRRLLELHPEWDGVFELRRARVDSEVDA